MAITNFESGYAPVNGLNLYYEIHGEGEPLFLLHGGFGSTGSFANVIPRLAEKHQVIPVDLHGHGRTGDGDRPLSFELMGDDIAGVMNHLGLDTANVLGYSLGGGTALQLAIRHPERVRQLVVVSTPFARNGWFPEMRAGMAQLGLESAEAMKNLPFYETYLALAPDPGGWPALHTKLHDLLTTDYDWSAQIAALKMPILFAFGDSDGMPTSHVAQFFALLGGGLRDGGWQGEHRSSSRLVILPGVTHYNITESPLLWEVVEELVG